MLCFSEKNSLYIDKDEFFLILCNVVYFIIIEKYELVEEMLRSCYWFK